MPKRRPPKPDEQQRQRDHDRARQAAANADQIARQIATFMRTLPAERTEWDPPKSFRDLTVQLADTTNALRDYAAWARSLPDPSQVRQQPKQQQE